MTDNRYNDNPPKPQEKVVSPISREPGKVPSQVPSAEIEKKFYCFYKRWNRRAA